MTLRRVARLCAAALAAAAFAAVAAADGSAAKPADPASEFGRSQDVPVSSTERLGTAEYASLMSPAMQPHASAEVPSADDPRFLNCSTPQFGIDWFGFDNRNERWVPGKTNRYFDVNRPIVLHAPGWELGRCDAHQKTTFNLRLNSMIDNMPVNENAADYWVARGWNIGIFQWNAFNEDWLSRSEANIYKRDLRWRNDRGQLLPNGSSVSVTELYYRAYVSLFAGAVERQPRLEIRLTGNSLGGQLTIQLVRTLLERHGRSSPLLPRRIALLDPWFTAETTYERNRQAIREIAEAGILVEFYQSTNLCYYFYGLGNVFCKATDIKQIAALVRTHPDWVSNRVLGSTRVLRPKPANSGSIGSGAIASNSSDSSEASDASEALGAVNSTETTAPEAPNDKDEDETDPLPAAKARRLQKRSWWPQWKSWSERPARAGRRSLSALDSGLRMLLTDMSALPVSLKHVASFTDYYRSMALPPPRVACLNSSLLAGQPCVPELGLSASSPPEDVRREMSRTRYLVQITGKRTPSLADDVYARIGNLGLDDHVLIPRLPRHFNLIKQLRTRLDRRCQPQAINNTLILNDILCDGWSTL